RNFSSKIAEFVMQGVGQSLSKEKEVVSIPLPHQLTKAQRDWLKHEHSEALLGSIMYQLLSDPARAASLLDTLNSNSLNLDDALHLKEEVAKERTNENHLEKTTPPNELSFEDDLDSFKFESIKDDYSTKTVEKEDPSDDDLDSLLGDFLAEMNK